MTALPERQYEGLVNFFERKGLPTFLRVAAQRLSQIAKEHKVTDIHANLLGGLDGIVVFWLDLDRPLIAIQRSPLQPGTPVNERKFFLSSQEEFALEELRKAGHQPGIFLLIGQSAHTTEDIVVVSRTDARNNTADYLRTEYWKNLIPYPGVPHAYRLVEVNRAPFVHPSVFTNFLNRIDPLGE
jgi:hypothetical protein